jgi:hypothetical protein
MQNSNQGFPWLPALAMIAYRNPMNVRTNTIGFIGETWNRGLLPYSSWSIDALNTRIKQLDVIISGCRSTNRKKWDRAVEEQDALIAECTARRAANNKIIAAGVQGTAEVLRAENDNRRMRVN